MFQLRRLFFVDKIHSVTIGSQNKNDNSNDIFSQIVGYHNIKELLELALLSEYSTSILYLENQEWENHYFLNV